METDIFLYSIFNRIHIYSHYFLILFLKSCQYNVYTYVFLVFYFFTKILIYINSIVMKWLCKLHQSKKIKFMPQY